MNNSKICKNCEKNFEISAKHLKFYKTMDVPAPSLCPTCRMQRRLAYRNDRSLYKDQCDLTSKEIISMYKPASDCKVYDHHEWWSDKWDPMDYARDFDFNRSFFEQFAELQSSVPRFNLFNKDTENCDYVNYAPHCKNCYLLFGSWFNEDSYYGQTLNECKDCVDNLFLDKSQLCYENIDCNENYQSFFCQNSGNLTDCYFCFDCKNLNNCIGCWNLRNKEYYILNKPVSQEEFEKMKATFSSSKKTGEAKKYFQDFIKKNAVFKDYTGLNNENVSGDFIFNCKNAEYCFSTYRSEDIAFCGRIFDQKDSYDTEGGGKGELAYESMSNDFAYNSIGCSTCEYLKDSHYCDLCFSCKNCFGCVGLRNKEYCIFNRQYSKEDYEELFGKIKKHMQEIKEWGEFFPINLSPFAYNETMAQEYFPISKEMAEEKGYKWYEEEVIINATSGNPSVLEDDIDETENAILNEKICCKNCKKEYKIIEPEYNFYKRIKIPVPHECQNCRHKERMEKRNPRHIWTRECANCKKEIATSYRPEHPGKICCEECYLKAIL